MKEDKGWPAKGKRPKRQPVEGEVAKRRREGGDASFAMHHGEGQDGREGVCESVEEHSVVAEKVWRKGCRFQPSFSEPFQATSEARNGFEKEVGLQQILCLQRAWGPGLRCRHDSRCGWALRRKDAQYLQRRWLASTVEHRWTLRHTNNSKTLHLHGYSWNGYGIGVVVHPVLRMSAVW